MLHLLQKSIHLFNEFFTAMEIYNTDFFKIGKYTYAKIHIHPNIQD